MPSDLDSSVFDNRSTPTSPVCGEEEVARAMKERAAQPLHNIPSLERISVGSLGDAWPYLARAAITAHIAALHEAGLVIVPREPTEEMTEAGWPHVGEGCHPDWAWSDMIDAAPTSLPTEPVSQDTTSKTDSYPKES